MLSDPKTQIDIELMANAKRLRRQAVEAEARWRGEHCIAVTMKPRRKRNVSAWARWRRRQLGKLGAASKGRRIDPVTGEVLS